ncbi:MAG: hypothetical protein M1820_006163 [Bogoriella megaspora]|nr:MAG: hypothetical protein M1820_006163 [Bogoriella megaspora]
MDGRGVIVIIGITGNQGGSVARTFLHDPSLRSKYRIRGLSRDPTSESCKSLLDLGVPEIVQANLHDIGSLNRAFEGAEVIFSVTDFWHPFFDPKNRSVAEQAGKTIGKYAYDLEYEQGRNIADAAAKVPHLRRIIISMLNSPMKWSNGIYNELWHFESKADMISYIQMRHINLASKMSTVQMGVFYTSWKFEFNALHGPQKMEDGLYKMVTPCDPNAPVPLVDPRRDTGPFVRALLEVAPGVNLLGETSMLSSRDWLRLWAKIVGVERAEYVQCSVDEWDTALPDGKFGKELADMFKYTGEFGYDGNDSGTIRKDQLGVPLRDLSSVEDYIRNEDWSSIGIGR